MPEVRERNQRTYIDFPAKFSGAVLDEVRSILDGELVRPLTVFDPFGGVGGVHHLRTHGYQTWAIEIEPEWARVAPWTFVGNALDPKAVRTIANHAPFDVIFTSPAYGNRMADHHHAADACSHCDGDGCTRCGGLGLSRRNTYAHRLREAADNPARALHVDNAGGMQWGAEYREFHRKAWKKTVPLLKHDGLFILNTSDHIRDGVRQHVNGFHVATLCALGLRVIDVTPVATRRNRNGANARLRVDGEIITTFRK